MVHCPDPLIWFAFVFGRSVLCIIEVTMDKITDLITAAVKLVRALGVQFADDELSPEIIKARDELIFLIEEITMEAE